MESIDISLVINRIKEQKNFRTDGEIAEFLGMKQPTFSRWKSKIDPNFNYIIDAGRCFDLNYIFYGTSRNFADAERLHQLETENAALRQQLSDAEELLRSIASHTIGSEEFRLKHHEQLANLTKMLADKSKTETPTEK